jgi:hypothetical protein
MTLVKNICAHGHDGYVPNMVGGHEKWFEEVHI